MSEHDATRSQLAGGDLLDDRAAAHLGECVECKAWQRRLQRILNAAPHLGDADDRDASSFVDETVSSVRDTVRRERQRRVGWLGAAAAAVAMVAVGAVVVTRSSSSSEDRLAAAADGYEEQGSFRFVLDTQAAVTVEVAAGPATPPGPVSLRDLPVCDTPAETPAPTIDLQPALDALLGDDPCSALDAIGTDLGADTTATAETLVDQRRQWEQRAASLSATTAGGSSQLQQQSAAVLAADAETQAAERSTRLDALVAAHNQVETSLTPIATAASSGDTTAVGTLTPVAYRDVQALVDSLDISDLAGPPNTATASWDQLTTGTWTTDRVELSGTATSADGTELEVRSVASDPLGLTAVLFDTPERLLAVLRSAPTGDGDTITWTVPDDVVGADTGTWTATATLRAGQLDTLVLSGVGVDGGDVTLTFTPAR